MKHTERLMAVALILSACDGAPPATAPDRTGPALARSGGSFRSFRVPTDNAQPRHITLGPDGNMWFTLADLNGNVYNVGRIDAKGKITEFVVPEPSSAPDDIVAGADGALWFTMLSGFPGIIGRVTTSGEFTLFDPGCSDLGGCSGTPQGITSGPDGNLWFTERLRNAIGKLTPAGEFTFYTIPTLGANPAGITAGPDGAVWFTSFEDAGIIGRIDMLGNITEFCCVTRPDRITTGPDGNLWFTEPFPFHSRIGRITTSGVITEFQLPLDTEPRDIVAGADGNLYVTLYGTDQLARMTTGGAFTVVADTRAGPFGIGRGLAGTIWLTQYDANQIGRFTIAP